MELMGPLLCFCFIPSCGKLIHTSLREAVQGDCHSVFAIETISFHQGGDEPLNASGDPRMDNQTSAITGFFDLLSKKSLGTGRRPVVVVLWIF